MSGNKVISFTSLPFFRGDACVGEGFCKTGVIKVGEENCFHGGAQSIALRSAPTLNHTLQTP